MAVERRDELVDPVRAVDEALGRQRRGLVGRPSADAATAAAQTSRGTRWKVVPHHSGVAGSSTETQRRSSASWMTVGRSVASACAQRPLELGVGSTRTPRAPDGPGDRREVERPELRGDALAGAAPLLPHPDRAVALVVEADDDDPRALADRGLELAPSSSPGRRRRRSRRPGRSRWTRAAVIAAGSAVAHRPRCRAEEGAGPPEPEAAGDPAAEVAGVGRQDRVVGEDPPERADDAAGMDAGPVPWRGVDDRVRLPGRAVRRRWRRPGSRRARRRARHRRAAARWRP